MLRSGERTWCDKSVPTSEEHLLQSDLKASQHSPWSLSSWHHTWKGDIKSATYTGFCRLLSVLWGYPYAHWGQWRGSRCLLWAPRQGVLNCTQRRGGSTLGKLIGCAELRGKLAPTSYSCSYSVTVSGTLVWQKFQGFRYHRDFQSLALSGTKDLNLQLSGTRRQFIHSTIKIQTYSRADLHSTIYLNNDTSSQGRAIVFSRLFFWRFCRVFNFTSENALCSRQESCVIYRNAW